jgi:hypothetical protein
MSLICSQPNTLPWCVWLSGERPKSPAVQAESYSIVCCDCTVTRDKVALRAQHVLREFGVGIAGANLELV